MTEKVRVNVYYTVEQQRYSTIEIDRAELDEWVGSDEERREPHKLAHFIYDGPEYEEIRAASAAGDWAAADEADVVSLDKVVFISDET